MVRQARRFTAAERAALWDGWKRGLSLVDIGRGLDRRAATVLRVIRQAGGYAPTPRRRAARSLQVAEREEISRGIAAQMSIRAIARQLGRCASTISREINRNGGREGYRAAPADAQTWRRACRPQLCRLARQPRLRQWVARSCRRIGLPGRSRLACGAHSRMIWLCGCPTRQSIAAFLCRLEESSSRSW